MKLLIINPNSKKLYQSLAPISAIEPNIWAGLLANSVRGICDVQIYDMEAEPPDDEAEFISRLDEYDADCFLFVVTGQNPNASSASMAGATESAKLISEHFHTPIGFVGPHVNALPYETLERHDFIDFVFTNEGVYALRNLIANKFKCEDIKGVWYRDRKTNEIRANQPEGIVPQEKLGVDLPGMAFDLLPSLDKYRTSQWHANYQPDTSPFTSVYTSLGCFAKCSFCLDGNTKITFANERSRKIKDVKIGDVLIGWDEEKNDYAQTIVQKTSHRVSEQIYRIEFVRDGVSHVIRCTGEHPFYVKGQWVDAKNLRVGDPLLMMGKYDKCQFRMKWFNPAFDSEVALRSAQTRKNNGYVPYMCTEKGIEKIRVAARKRGLSKDNPMLQPHNKLAASLRMRGEKNPCWAGGVSTMFQEYPVEFSAALKRRIRKRDQVRCQECGAKNCKLDVHHIDYDKENNYECNLITLCASCHSKTNFDRSEYQKRYQGLQRARGFCPTEVMIKKIDILDESRDVFNVECHPHNNYFANNVLVHNCMINIINRTNNDTNAVSSDFNTFRYWDPEFTIKQLEYLADQGVKHIKIADEMFVYRPKHFMRLCELIIERGLKFNIWAYSRIDTAKPKYLETLKRAGVNWLALGIESANQVVRQEIDKGRFKDVNIRDIVKSIQDHGIAVVGNYIVGLTGDTHETMLQTKDLAFELLTENMNVYCATSLPGSPLYMQDKLAGRRLPTEYSEFGFLSYDHVPSRTDSLTSEEILKFRDQFFEDYFTHQPFLDKVYSLYGGTAVQTIRDMTKLKLRRKLLE